MKKKGLFVAYLLLALLLTHLILVAGCGKNPFVSALGGAGGGNVNIGIGRL